MRAPASSSASPGARLAVGAAGGGGLTRGFHARGELGSPPSDARGDSGGSVAEGETSDGEPAILCRAKLSAVSPSPAAASATSLDPRSAPAPSARSLAAFTRAASPLLPPPHAAPAPALPARSGLVTPTVTTPGTGLKGWLGPEGSRAGPVPWVAVASGVRRERCSSHLPSPHAPPLPSAPSPPLSPLPSLHPSRLAPLPRTSASSLAALPPRHHPYSSRFNPTLPRSHPSPTRSTPSEARFVAERSRAERARAIAAGDATCTGV